MSVQVVKRSTVRFLIMQERMNDVSIPIPLAAPTAFTTIALVKEQPAQHLSAALVAVETRLRRDAVVGNLQERTHMILRCDLFDAPSGRSRTAKPQQPSLLLTNLEEIRSYLSQSSPSGSTMPERAKLVSDDERVGFDVDGCISPKQHELYILDRQSTNTLQVAASVQNGSVISGSFRLLASEAALVDRLDRLWAGNSVEFADTARDAEASFIRGQAGLLADAGEKPRYERIRFALALAVALPEQ